jgi:hypothetical protein
MEGRRLDFDYKKKRHGKMPDEEIRLAVDKFEESKDLAERSMFNFFENDVSLMLLPVTVFMIYFSPVKRCVGGGCTACFVFNILCGLWVTTGGADDPVVCVDRGRTRIPSTVHPHPGRTQWESTTEVNKTTTGLNIGSTGKARQWAESFCGVVFLTLRC